MDGTERTTGTLETALVDVIKEAGSALETGDWGTVGVILEELFVRDRETEAGVR